MCRKSGSMLLGTDVVLNAVRSDRHKLCLVLLAKDASENTRKKIKNCCASHKVLFRDLIMDGEAFGHLMGKTGVLMAAGIANDSFAAAILKLLEAESNASEQREDEI